MYYRIEHASILTINLYIIHTSIVLLREKHLKITNHCFRDKI